MIRLMNVMISETYSVTQVRTSGGSTFNALYQTYVLLHIVEEVSLQFLGKIKEFDAFLLQTINNLVIDIGNIHDKLSNTIYTLTSKPK
jgi:hypothetical protein